jgi:hypothetical protein
VVTSGARTPNRERGGVFLNFSRHRPPVRVGQHTLRLQLWSFPPLPGAPHFPGPYLRIPIVGGPGLVLHWLRMMYDRQPHNLPARTNSR